jgi:hypothetical protein
LSGIFDSTGSGIVLRHQSARAVCVRLGLLASSNATVTPVASWRMDVTFAPKRMTLSTSRARARAIMSMPPTGWNIVI